MASEPGKTAYSGPDVKLGLARFARKALIIAAICAALLAACYAYLRAAVCTTESERKIRNLSGLDFEIETTYCSGFGASVHTKVYASRGNVGGQTLLFEYDPIDWISLPSISVPTTDRIVISVPRVSDIYARRYRWQGVRIEYEIERIDTAKSEQRLPDN